VVATLAQILKRCARSMVEEVNKTNGREYVVAKWLRMSGSSKVEEVLRSNG
jgi:hypothetical protein